MSDYNTKTDFCVPPHWRELTKEQQDKVNRYIRTLLAQQIPIIERSGREVIEQKIKAGVSYQLEKILCGKNCHGCPHGPYWYAYYRKNGKVISKYIGKKLEPLPKSYVTDSQDAVLLLHKTPKGD